MDTYFEFSFLLNEPEGQRASSNEFFGADASSTDLFDVLADAETPGQSLSAAYCIIC